MPTPLTPGQPTPSPRVAAFERLAFGMFVHWGLYSQLAQGEWTMHLHKIPRDEYLKLMQTFTATDFDARHLVQTAKRAGMKYVTHTSRHHEGFSLYDTRGLSDLDVTHTPCGRDLVREFVDGCRAEGILPMLYCTTLDWSDPRFDADFPAYLQYLRDSVEVLCTHYGKIGGFWFDGNWSRPDADWEEDKLYAVIRKLQPDALIINNTGIEFHGMSGHSEIDSVTFERGRADPLDRTGAPKYVASEMCHTMNYHWGTSSKDFNYLSPAHVIEELCFARRAGANLLMNIGPGPHGAIPEYEAAALAKVGDWIALYGGSDGVLYNGTTSVVRGDGDDFVLEWDGDLYLFVTDLTATSDTRVFTGARGSGQRRFTGVVGDFQKATWMDSGEAVTFSLEQGALTLDVRDYPYGTNTVVRVAKLER